MKAILIGTDLTVRCDRALERAMALAKQHDSQLYVMSVVDEKLPENEAIDRRAEAERKLETHIAELKGGGGPTVTVEVTIGTPGSDLVAWAEQTHAELIVLGVRDPANESFFRGTTCDQIIRHGNAPVLVVRDRVSPRYEKVMVAVDFSVHSRRAIQFTLDLAPEAEIYLVHAYQVPFEGFIHGGSARQEVSSREIQQMQKMVEEEMAHSLAALKGDTSRLHQVLRHGDVRKVIRQEVESLKPDLLALGTHGRTGIAHAFLGSVAEDVLRNPPCDALAVKAW